MIMTPKERSNYLINTYWSKLDCQDEWLTACECAIIHVNGIFDFMRMDDEYNEDCHMANTHWPGYWIDVMMEINNTKNLLTE